MDAKAFRRALAMFATGVTVVTTTRDGVDYGVTANSFSSVSLDPPLVLWSLARKSSSIQAFQESPRFAVNLLAIHQRSVSNAFARSSAPEAKFVDVAIARGIGDVPLLQGCSAWFECETLHRYEGGDHVIFVGRVARFEQCDKTPLVFMAGEYGIAARAHEEGVFSVEEDPDAGPTWDRDALSYPLSRVYLQFAHAQEAPLKALGIDNRVEFAVLAGLLVKGEASIDEIRKLFFYTSRPLSDAMIEALLNRNFVQRGSAEGTLRLSIEGHQCIVRAIATEKAWEASALEPLTHGEAIVLKQLLRRVMAATDQNAIPTPWG